MFKTIIIINISISTIFFTGLVSSANSLVSSFIQKFDSIEYQKFGDVIINEKIELPTVFKIDTAKLFLKSKNNLQVVNQNVEPTDLYYKTQTIDSTIQKPNLSVKSLSPTKQYINFVFDQNLESYTEFDLDRDKGKASFEFDLDGLRNVEGLEIDFADDIKTPEFVEIIGQNSNDIFTVLAKTPISSLNTILFPKVKSQKLTVNLFHTQVLRIKEIRPILPDQLKPKLSEEVFFLAKPGDNYKVYFNDTDSIIGNYKSLPTDLGYDVKTAIIDNLSDNPIFINKDVDKDGVKDLIDNCPKASNTDQIDKDKNGIGDGCEDRDLDRVIDANDNCPLIANLDQKDSDNDKSGDACDGFDNRILETNTWIVPVAITVCSILVIIIFASRLRKIGD